MEKYIINGIEIEYDTFDLDNMERRQEAAKAVAAEAVQQSGENDVAFMRRFCEAVLGFFDEIFGEGASREIFGGRVNFAVILRSYRDFNAEVQANTRKAVRDALGVKDAELPEKASAEIRPACEHRGRPGTTPSRKFKA